MIVVGTRVGVMSASRYSYNHVVGRIGIVAKVFQPDKQKISYANYFRSAKDAFEASTLYDPNLKIGVRVDGVINPHSAEGLFWFDENELMVIPASEICGGLSINKVIFNDPKTIILWSDGSKTVVSCKNGESFDKYSGFCAAVTKKIFGSTSHAKKILNEKETTPKNGA